MSMINRQIVKDYIDSQKEMLVFANKNKQTPPEIQIEASNKLLVLRRHLDKIGLKMPPAKYYYNPENQRTWKYLPYTAEKKASRMTIENPNFKDGKSK